MSLPNFHLIEPCEALRPFVQSYWTGDFNFDAHQNARHTVLPNGCIELIVHLSDDHCFLQNSNSEWSSTPLWTIIGAFLKPYEVKFDYPVKVFGVRFFPDGFKNIFGIPPADFNHTYTDSHLILGSKLHDLCRRIRESGSELNRIVLINEFLLSGLSANFRKWDTAHHAMQLIRLRSGIIKHQEITDQIAISPRQLQREFRENYGITISDYIRLLRMNEIQRYMQSHQQKLTSISYGFHFSDQAHFTKEFKHFAGITPKKFNKMKDHFLVNPAA